MTLTLSAEDAAFRNEVRAFLDAALTGDLRAEGQNCTGIYCEYPAANRWHRILAQRGWSVPRWPVEHGGTGWTPSQHYIFSAELARAGAPAITPNAIDMVGPVIIAFGNKAQKEFYLPRIRNGDDWWAQGYSEPEAGSDLASLKCAAVADGDDYVINGSKIWTTHAHFSNRIFCLVRTNREGRKQEGISFLLIDLDSPGIEIRPILSISGDHELNEVFFTKVRVPRAGLIGEENEGWKVAKYLLTHERSYARAPALRANLEKLRSRARDTARGPTGQLFALKLADAEITLTALEGCELRNLSHVNGAGFADATASALKVLGTELRQRIDELGIELAGAAAITKLFQPDLARSPDLLRGARAANLYLNDRAASIYAGTNEIQRTIIAKSLLSSNYGTEPLEGNFSFEQRMLSDSLRGFFGSLPKAAGIRDAWRRCGSEMGVIGIGFPQDFGGIGGGSSERMIVMEELGRAASNLPYLEAAVMAGSILRQQDERTHGPFMEAATNGEVIVLPLWNTTLDDLEAKIADTATAITAKRVDGVWRLTGTKAGVISAPSATHFLIFAEIPEAREYAFFLVDRHAPGLSLDAFETLDERGMASVDLAGVEVDDTGRLSGPEGSVRLLDRMYDEGIAAAAAEALGLCISMLAQTIAYTGQRTQFGQPLSNFQVLQHRMADMHMQIEQLRSMVWLATRALDAPSAERNRVVSAAKVAADRTCRFVAQNAIQLHGGMGMTDELDLARYIRRALVLELSFGGQAYHLQRYTQLSV